MSAAALAHDAFAPVEPPGKRAGLGFALVAHALLIAALAWSVHWNTSEPEGVTAELWSALPQTAAPRVAPPPAPLPPLRVEPAPARPDPAAQERADAQIAIERAAREKTRLEALAREEEAKRQTARERDQRKLDAAERERQRQFDEQRTQKEELAKAKQAEARAAAEHDANVRRMMARAGTADSATPGTAARTSGPSAGYAGRIKARIKPNIVLTGDVAGNPITEIEVRVAPDGTIVGRKITRSSGSPLWDETVLRAIDKTEVLPKDIDGRIPPVIPMTFQPHE